MKLTKRKGFSFMRSYFDVLNKLQSDEDKLSFLMAIINKQFLNEEPTDLKFPVDLAYDSQFNNIDSSVKGWIRANKTDLQGNSIDTPPTPPKGKTHTPPKEEEEEEEEKEEVKHISSSEEKIDKFLVWFNSKKEKATGKKSSIKVLSKSSISNLKSLSQKYSSDDFNKAIQYLFKNKWAINNNGLTPNHFLVVENFTRYLAQADESGEGKSLAEMTSKERSEHINKIMKNT